MFDPKKLAAEFVGTFILVFIAVGVATESFGFKLLRHQLRRRGGGHGVCLRPRADGPGLRHRAHFGLPT